MKPVWKLRSSHGHCDSVRRGDRGHCESVRSRQVLLRFFECLEVVLDIGVMVLLPPRAFDSRVNQVNDSVSTNLQHVKDC